MLKYLFSIFFLLISIISIAQKPRLIVTTDIGQDPDDEQSMVRLLHLANEFEIEGIIVNADANYEHEEPIVKASIIFDMLDSYAEIEDNLRKHSADYPTVDYLKSKVKTGCAGNGDKIPMEAYIGEGKDTEGSEWIIKVVDQPNDKPIHIAIWGGACDLAQALWKIEQERSQAEVRKFVSKLRVLFIGKQDTSNQWIMDTFPNMWLVLSLDENDKWLSSYRGMFWGGDMSTTSKDWLHENIIDVSPLGAHYPDKAHTGGKSRNPHMAMKEGDSPSLLFFIENGLNQTEHPEWGGWGGRYQLLRNQFYVDTEDEYYDHSGKLVQSPRATVFRWRGDFQNDFAARVQWGTKKFDDANHHPEVVVNGERGKSPLFIAAKPGQNIKIDASKSLDPDGDSLNYEWEIYWEAGSYPNQFDYVNTGDKFKLKIPDDSSGTSMHILLKVRDQGLPVLTSYKRIILEID